MKNLSRRKVMSFTTLILCSISFQQANSDEIMSENFIITDTLGVSRKVMSLSDDLKEQLKLVSRNNFRNFTPVAITNMNGQIVDNLYFYNADKFLDNEGVWPDPKYVYPLKYISKINISDTAIPKVISEKIYNSGETGMGYSSFILRTRQGLTVPVMTGNYVDFIVLPERITASDIIDVEVNVSPENLSNAGSKIFRNKPHRFIFYKN